MATLTDEHGNLQPVCQNCTTSTTPLWRRDELGSVLCNACGLFLKLHGRPRPISLKTDVIKSRNRVKSAGQNQKRKVWYTCEEFSRKSDILCDSLCLTVTDFHHLALRLALLHQIISTIAESPTEPLQVVPIAPTLLSLEPPRQACSILILRLNICSTAFPWPSTTFTIHRLFLRFRDSRLLVLLLL